MANPGNRGGFGFAEQQRGHDAGRTSTQMGGGQGNMPEEQGATGVLGTIKEKASDLASGVASTAEHAWDATRHAAQNVASTVATGAEEAWDSVTGFMRRYPLATLGIGVGIGFLLAELLMSRRA
jgi:ElaB/YqjD/DUF883 family membrane-anchored ribosome-binding protein